MKPTPLPSLHSGADPRIDQTIGILAEQTNNIIAVVDNDGLRVLRLNPTARHKLGVTEDASLDGITLTDFIPEALQKNFADEVVATALRDGVWRGDFSLLAHDGTELPVSLVVVCRRDSSNTAPCFALAARDMSAQRRVETSLEAQRTFLQVLLENVPDCIYFKDRESRFVCVSTAKAHSAGAGTPEELIGKTDFDHFSSEHAQKAYDDEQRIIATGEPVVDVEERETWPDGRVTWASTSKMPLRDSEGNVIGTFGISRDITARKETELQLKATQKELLEASRLAGMAEIASGVLHNIGNGLNSVNTSIVLVSEQLERSRVGNLVKAARMIEEHGDNIAEYLSSDERGRMLPGYLVQLAGMLESERKDFQSEIAQLRRSIEHIKDIVAMQQNYARVSKLEEDASPAELVDEALRISEMSLNRHGIEVHRDFARVPNIRVTRHKVLQILVNFIRNAKYAIDETGRTDRKDMTIALRTSQEGQVRIIVQDTGVGIAPENLKRIFTFGFTTRKNGHGFGLHSSANAAKQLNGRILVASDGPGKGASFTLEIPAAPAAAKAA